MEHEKAGKRHLMQGGGGRAAWGGARGQSRVEDDMTEGKARACQKRSPGT